MKKRIKLLGVCIPLILVVSIGIYDSIGIYETTKHASVEDGVFAPFSTKWVARAEGSRLFLNPIFMSDHPSARLRVYGGPMAGLGLDGSNNTLPNRGDWIAHITPKGYSWDFTGKAIGEYRFSYGRPGSNDWAEYGPFAKILSKESLLLVEEDRMTGGYGLKLKWDGKTIQPAGNL